jgi:ATP-dependent DNA helicase RecQ
MVNKKSVRSKAVKESVSDTFLKTFHLYKEGNSIAEIAQIRNLGTMTIEGHLSEFVANGQLTVERFVSDYKLAAIVKVIEEKGRLSLRVIKDVLGDDYSYFEIKIAVAYMKWLEQQ